MAIKDALEPLKEQADGLVSQGITPALLDCPECPECPQVPHGLELLWAWLAAGGAILLGLLSAIVAIWLVVVLYRRPKIQEKFHPFLSKITLPLAVLNHVYTDLVAYITAHPNERIQISRETVLLGIGMSVAVAIFAGFFIHGAWSFAGLVFTTTLSIFGALFNALFGG